MSSEQVEATAAPEGPSVAEPAARRRTLRNLGLVVVAVIALDILALLFVPPFPRGGQPGDACTFPVCYINGTLEFPPPHVVLDLDPGNPMPTGSAVVTFHPSITSTIVTMWIIMAILIVLGFMATRGMRQVPGGSRTSSEFAYESSRTSAWVWAASGPAVHPLFVSFFVLILFCNWSGLIPPVGSIEELRAPTSDLNITIGLALVAFVFFEFQGSSARGRRLPEQFFPFYEFRKGIGAGIIALFVGLIELMLEFVKPVTLRCDSSATSTAARSPWPPSAPCSSWSCRSRCTARGDPELRPGADLQRPHPDVHAPGDREPRQEEGEMVDEGMETLHESGGARGRAGP